MRERYDIVCLLIQACEGTLYYMWNQSEPERRGGVAYWVRGKSGCGQLLYHRVQLSNCWSHGNKEDTLGPIFVYNMMQFLIHTEDNFLCIKIICERTSIFRREDEKIAGSIIVVYGNAFRLY